MTIDEAIKHAEEMACSKCSKCADEHRQLAEWLKELKELKKEKEANKEYKPKNGSSRFGIVRNYKL